MTHYSYSTSELITLWRLERGLTQVQLARKSLVPQPNLSNIEKGKSDVTLGTLKKVAQALEIRIGELVEGTGPQYQGTRKPLTRSAYITIASAELNNKLPQDNFHQYLADRFRSIIPGLLPKRVSKNQLNLIWSNLKTSLTREEFNQILEKIQEHQLRHHEN